MEAAEKKEKEATAKKEKKKEAATMKKKERGAAVAKTHKDKLAQKYVIIKNDGDGDCLFRAVSQEMYGGQSNHLRLRSVTCDVMDSSVFPFADYVEDNEDPKEYIQRMRRSGQYGGNQEMLALVIHLERQFEVHDHLYPDPIWIPDPKGDEGLISLIDGDEPPIRLLRLDKHFELMQDVKAKEDLEDLEDSEDSEDSKDLEDSEDNDDEEDTEDEADVSVRYVPESEGDDSTLTRSTGDDLSSVSKSSTALSSATPSKNEEAPTQTNSIDRAKNMASNMYSYFTTPAKQPMDPPQSFEPTVSLGSSQTHDKPEWKNELDSVEKMEQRTAMKPPKSVSTSRASRRRGRRLENRFNHANAHDDGTERQDNSSGRKSATKQADHKQSHRAKQGKGHDVQSTRKLRSQTTKKK